MVLTSNKDLLFHALLKAELKDRHVLKIDASKDNRLAEKVIDLIERHFEPTASQKRAEEIMKGNFFGVPDAIEYFGIRPTEEQVKILSEIPFSEEILKECKDTHVLAAIFPLSIIKIIEGAGSDLFYGDNCYDGEDFFGREGELEWRLISKIPVGIPSLRSYKKRIRPICDNGSEPTAQAMVYTIIGHYLKTGETLFENVYVRTSSTDSGGFRVYAGFFASGGLLVRCRWNKEIVVPMLATRLPGGPKLSFLT